MLIRRIIELGVQPKRRFLALFSSHNKTCSVPNPPECPDLGDLLYMKDSEDSIGVSGGLTRAILPGKCRMGFIPEEWFVFFKPLTGVSGPYFLMLGLGNYVASKEILVMEHEYYLGLSVGLVLYFVTTKLGPQLGAYLDKEVNVVANRLEQDRRDDVEMNDKIIAEAEQAKWRAKGQKYLIEAKKENIAMQLETIYRDRQMIVYERVRGRMDYFVKRQMVERIIEEKCMMNWLMREIYRSITPELKKLAMDSALSDLDALARRNL